MKRVEIGRIAVGGVYRNYWTQLVKQEDGSKIVQEVEGGLFRVVCFALHQQTRREEVVYVAMDGYEIGQHFVCSTQDFAGSCRPEKQEEIVPEVPPAPPPDRPAGRYSTEGEQMKESI